MVKNEQTIYQKSGFGTNYVILWKHGLRVIVGHLHRRAVFVVGDLFLYESLRSMLEYPVPVCVSSVGSNIGLNYKALVCLQVKMESNF